MATTLAVPFVGLSFLLKLMDAIRGSEHLYFDASITLTLVTQFLPIALPLIAGIALGLQQTQDAARRVHRYRDMLAELDAAQRKIVHLKTPASLRRAIVRLEESLMDEQLEWQIATQAGR